MNVFTSSGYVLVRIAQHPRITQKMLAEEMGISIRYVARIINGLINDGALLPVGAGRRRGVELNLRFHDDSGFALIHLNRLDDLGPATERNMREQRGTLATGEPGEPGKVYVTKDKHGKTHIRATWE